MPGSQRRIGVAEPSTAVRGECPSPIAPVETARRDPGANSALSGLHASSKDVSVGHLGTSQCRAGGGHWRLTYGWVAAPGRAKLEFVEASESCWCDETPQRTAKSHEPLSRFSLRRQMEETRRATDHAPKTGLVRFSEVEEGKKVVRRPGRR